MRTPLLPLVFLLAAPGTACHRAIASLDPVFPVESSVRTRFQPPQDTALTERVSSSLRRGDAADVQEAEMTTVTRFTAEPNAWRLGQRVTQARYTRAGVPVRSLVDTVLSRVEVAWRLAEDGTFVELAEPAVQWARVQDVLRREAAPGLDVTPLERFFAPDTLAERLRSEWEVKYGGIYGRTLVPGQRGYAVGSLPLGEGRVTYLLERTFLGTRLTEHGEALVFSLVCLGPPGSTSPEAVREALREAGEPELTPGVECGGEQLLGRGRFLPVRWEFTLRAEVGADTWSWATRSTLESLEEQPPPEETP
jgi:hypothetical protein